MSEPCAIVSVAEMRALEAAAIADGTHERVLQERAGLAVADAVEREVAVDGQARRRPRVVVLVGAGNNGRDGVVAGRRLASRGSDVILWLGPRHALTVAELRDLRADGLEIGALGEASALPRLASDLAHADVAIDGLLGVGSRGPMRPALAEIAAALNEASDRPGGPLVVAVDVPSGIDADTGATPGAVVRADLTVTFGAMKAGLLRFPGAALAGRVVVAPIGLPAGLSGHHPVQVLDRSSVRSCVPERAADAHKYRFGRVLVVAGSDQFVGAACLGAESAARSGTGLVGVVSTAAVKQVLAARLPEATYPLTLDAVEPGDVAATVAALLPEQAALLLGPGIGREPAADALVRGLLRLNAEHARPTPTVVDADALTLLAGWDRWWDRMAPGTLVLTPHAGEMARLLATCGETPPGEAPWATALRAAALWRQVVVLKGPFTTVAEPAGRAWVHPEANAALATAGTGDVLAGVVAGLLAQRVRPADAARLAVVVHALAARRVATSRSTRTLLASDLPPEVPPVLAELARR